MYGIFTYRPWILWDTYIYICVAVSVERWPNSCNSAVHQTVHPDWCSHLLYRVFVALVLFVKILSLHSEVFPAFLSVTVKICRTDKVQIHVMYPCVFFSFTCVGVSRCQRQRWFYISYLQLFYDSSVMILTAFYKQLIKHLRLPPCWYPPTYKIFKWSLYPPFFTKAGEELQF